MGTTGAGDTRTNEEIVTRAVMMELPILPFPLPVPAMARGVVAALADAGRLVTPTGDTADNIGTAEEWRALARGQRLALLKADEALAASEAARAEAEAIPEPAGYARLRERVATLEARVPKCDGGCNYNDGPDETCSRDGRPVAEVWEIANENIARANQAEGDVEVLRDRVANLEAVITEARASLRGFRNYGPAAHTRMDMLLERAGDDPVVLREHVQRALTEYEANRKASLPLASIAGQPAAEWLREHDAKVLRDAADAIDAESSRDGTAYAALPEWLRDRAEAIEKGEGL